jgi:hypothetical protein
VLAADRGSFTRGRSLSGHPPYGAKGQNEMRGADACVAVLAIALPCCSGNDSEADADVANAQGAAATSIASTIDKAVAHCNEIAFPNSMARPPGFDINAHLAEVEQERRSLSARLTGAGSAELLRARLAASADDVEIHCLNQLIDEFNGRAGPEGRAD